MKPLWHPLSTLLLDQPRGYATPMLLRILLNSGGVVRLIYAGDRMWPSLRHGSTIEVDPLAGGGLEPGSAVVACPQGIPDLLRIEGVSGTRVRLAADADPQAGIALSLDDVLASARLPMERPGRVRRAARRLFLEVTEALRHPPDSASDPSGTVLRKYDTQSAFYAQEQTGAGLDEALRRRLQQRLPRSGTVLVVGSGTGRECFALARDGWQVIGVDFAPAMVRLASEQAQRAGLSVEFHTADVRGFGVPQRSLAGVLFTYDVYSFLPRAEERVALLGRMRSWLRTDGVVFLSARRVSTIYERAILTLQWMAGRRWENIRWGDSHTRWIAPDGLLRRSFIHVFSDRQLRSEIAAAGYRAGPWAGGHAVLRPRTAPAAATMSG